MSLAATIKKLYHNEVVRYLVAGAFNTAFGFLAFAGLFLLLQEVVHYLVVAVISSMLSITVAFFIYRYWVFKSSGNIWHEYLKIYVVYGGAVALNIVLLALLVEFVGLHPILGQLFVTLVTVIISYFGQSRFTFSSRTSETSPEER